MKQEIMPKGYHIRHYTTEKRALRKTAGLKEFRMFLNDKNVWVVMWRDDDDKRT